MGPAHHRGFFKRRREKSTKQNFHGLQEMHWASALFIRAGGVAQAVGGLPSKKALAGCWWLMPVILATQEQRSEGLKFKASLGK
jgi:hypothetical protein